ncbi:lipopolysaccharide heptosyltransferase I [Rhodotorula sp. JG-1b]|nr:lipopolysaccharide heptosyltransferase I [Rhodotorula sp. JG-1b]
MRLRTGASTLSPAHLAAIFAGAFAASLLLLRPAKQLYHPDTSAKYSPPDAPADNNQIHSSIVVPAYHERDNIAPLVKSVFAALRDPAGTEIVIVDDNSRDGTIEEVERLRREEGYNVELLVRTDEKGLSSAVLRGFERARGQKMIVMDADLQHPPEAVQPLLDALTPETPLALGTRYGEGVSMSKNWPLHRRVISWGARTLARPLTSASDPMTGFFGLTKDQLHRSKPINPSGFKIALELLLKSPHAATLPEVPYSFGIRTTGSSKLSSKVMLKYVGQLISLYVWAWGVFFHVLVAAGVTIVALLGDKVWRSRRRQLTRGQEYPLGGYHPDAGVPPLSPKAKGKGRASPAGGRGLTSKTGGGNSGGISGWVGNVVNGGNSQVLERKRFV